MSWIERLAMLEDGATEAWYRGRRWLVRKETRLGGRLVKLFAAELGGRDFVSLNLYLLSSRPLLKPCEMPERKVIAFLLGMRPYHSISSRVAATHSPRACVS
ncbi:hypothetical protein [Hydrogenimonas sp.]